MPFNIEDVIDIELTSAENAALCRLKASKEFDVFVSIITRRWARSVVSNATVAHEGQEIELAAHQGGYKLLKDIHDLLEDVKEPPAPRRK